MADSIKPAFCAGQKVYAARWWWTHTVPQNLREYEVVAVSDSGRVAVERGTGGRPIYTDNVYFATQREAWEHYASVYSREIEKHERSIEQLRDGLSRIPL